MKVKFYSIHSQCQDSKGETHHVTVVGKFTQEYVQMPFTQDVPVEPKPGHIVRGKLTFSKRTLHRTLTVGVSICHPSDEFNEEFGIELAKARIERGEDSGKIETNNVTMITEDLIMCELVGKLSYITAHIDDYLPNQ